MTTSGIFYFRKAKSQVQLQRLMDFILKLCFNSLPKAETPDVFAAKPGYTLLSGVLQVVGALVIDHHRQYEPRLYGVDIFCKAITLIFAAVRVKPVRMIQRLNER